MGAIPDMVNVGAYETDCIDLPREVLYNIQIWSTGLPAASTSVIGDTMAGIEDKVAGHVLGACRRVDFLHRIRRSPGKPIPKMGNLPLGVLPGISDAPRPMR